MEENKTETTETTETAQPKSKMQKGFACMPLEKRRAIATLGGKKAHELGKAHKFNSEEGRAAGRKGGLSVSRNSAHMAKIGRIGGKNRGKRNTVEK